MDKRIRFNLLYLVFVLLAAGRFAEVTVGDRLITGRLQAPQGRKPTLAAERSMVVRYGMVESLGQIAYGDEHAAFLPGLVPKNREYSEETAREIDVAVRAIVKRCYEKASAILAHEKPLLERGAQLVLQKETLAEAELAELRRGMALEKAA